MIARIVALSLIVIGLALAWSMPVSACDHGRDVTAAAVIADALEPGSEPVADVATAPGRAAHCDLPAPMHRCDGGASCDCMAACAAIVLPSDDGAHPHPTAAPIERTPAVDLLDLSRVPPTPPPRFDV